ncbi:MAG: hypothetical protein ACOZDY_06110 [Pseudomonadota bacterium]
MAAVLESRDGAFRPMEEIDVYGDGGGELNGYPSAILYKLQVRYPTRIVGSQRPVANEFGDL